MARRKIPQDEQKDRLKLQLDKAKEALQAAETRLSVLDTEREKLVAKIKERKTEVEKYQALTRDSQYSVLDEMLRLKGVNIEDVTKAIANGDMEYLLKLTELKAETESTEVTDKSEVNNKIEVSDKTEIKEKAEITPEKRTPEKIKAEELASSNQNAPNVPDKTANRSPVSVNVSEKTADAPNMKMPVPPIEQKQQARPQYIPNEPVQTNTAFPPPPRAGTVRANIPIDQRQQAQTPYATPYRADMPPAYPNGQPVKDNRTAVWQPSFTHPHENST